MTVTAARKVKVGLAWLNGPRVLGTVTETGYMGFKVQWEDGPIGVYFYRDNGDVEYLGPVNAQEARGGA